MCVVSKCDDSSKTKLNILENMWFGTNINEVQEIFDSTDRHGDVINLYLLFAPPVSMSMSCIAMMEASRVNGTLDVEFGKELYYALQENEGKEQGQDNKQEQSLVPSEQF